MAQFQGVVNGTRGKTSRLGSKNSGLLVKCNGWNTGIKVEASHDGSKDVFRVYLTGGSNHPEKCRLIACFFETPFVNDPVKLVDDVNGPVLTQK